MRLDQFDFALPDSLIAERPLEPREAARLLHIRPNARTDATIADLPDVLQPGDLLVTNDTRVIPARLFGQRGEARVEVLLHRQRTPLTWEVFAKPAKRLRPGDRWTVADDLHARVQGKTEQGLVILQFEGTADAFWQALERHGSMPLPPYIQRQADTHDKQDYQTIFAAKPGAVAAPTASLHFTPALLERLAAKGIQRATVTLHVGAGTFLPVKVEDIREHHMHSEIYDVPDATAQAIAETRARGGRVVAIGTTALRTLESVAAGEGRIHPGSGETDIFITPGYSFQVVDVLLTNFHLPKSTLFMLVSAFSGLEVMQAAYQHAIDSGYRFFSYGDACLLER